MTGMEDIISSLSLSPQFKQIIQKEVRCCLMERQEDAQPQVRLDSLVSEISSYMASITEYALEEDNSDRYFGLLKKNQQMYQQLEKKVQMELQGKIRELSEEVEQLKQQVKKTTKQLKNKPNESQRLRNQRRTITKSILQTSVMLGKSKARSTIQPGCLGSRINYQDGESQSECGDGFVLTNDSRSRQMETSYMNASYNKENQLTGKDLAKKVDKLLKDQASMSEQLKTINEKTQADLQSNLQGVWNVISDLNTRIAKFQSLSSLLAICPELQR